MIRKLLFALLLVGASFATTSQSDPWCEPEPAYPCDVVCEAPGPAWEAECDCPCWTDRRVEQSDCDHWNTVAGCWWL
jgi:hypothetical protein